MRPFLCPKGVALQGDYEDFDGEHQYNGRSLVAQYEHEQERISRLPTGGASAVLGSKQCEGCGVIITAARQSPRCLRCDS